MTAKEIDSAKFRIAMELHKIGMQMPLEWVQKNNDDSEFMKAVKLSFECMDIVKNLPGIE